MLQRFWAKSRDYLVLGVLLLIGLILLLAQDHTLYRSARAAALEITAPVDGLYARSGRFQRALQDNEALRTEAVELSAELARLRAARVENQRLRALVGFAEEQEEDMIPAQVVRKDMTRQQNLITLNVGSSDGVAAGMPVLDERGLVGRIMLTSSNYSLVMPHQNTDFTVAARIAELSRDGIVRWDGRVFDRLTMEFVVRTEPVEPGMLVTTSVASGTFPPGVPIGRVDSVFAARGRNDLVIYLTPSAPLSTVDIVYVLPVVPDDEREALEAMASQLTNRR